jgi:hypothetical protein
MEGVRKIKTYENTLWASRSNQTNCHTEGILWFMNDRHSSPDRMEILSDFIG